MGTRTFIRSRQAWYSQPGLGNDDLAKHEEFQMAESGIDGEIFVRYHSIGEPNDIARLEAFEDSLALLPRFADVFAAMAEAAATDSLRPDRMHEILTAAGVEDRTERRIPADLLRLRAAEDVAVDAATARRSAMKPS